MFMSFSSLFLTQFEMSSFCIVVCNTWHIHFHFALFFQLGELLFVPYFTVINSDIIRCLFAFSSPCIPTLGTLFLSKYLFFISYLCSAFTVCYFSVYELHLHIYILHEAYITSIPCL